MKDNYIKLESLDSKKIENNIQKNYISKNGFIIFSFITMNLMIYLIIQLCIKIENNNEGNNNVFQLIEEDIKSNYSFKATYEVNSYNENVELIYYFLYYYIISLFTLIF